MVQTAHPQNLEAFLELRYQIVLQPEEDGWSAYIPDLPGCVAGGDTIPETLALLEDARRSWIEASLRRGLSIPLPGGR